MTDKQFASLVFEWVVNHGWHLLFSFWAVWVLVTLIEIEESLDSLKKMYRDRS